VTRKKPGDAPVKRGHDRIKKAGAMTLRVQVIMLRAGEKK